MVDFDDAHAAEAARNNERSPQRGSVTGNVNTRRYGEESRPQAPEERLPDHEPEEDNDPGFDKDGIATKYLSDD